MTPARAAILGEFLGTTVLVAIGTGTVACSVLLGAPSATWQVAVVWGVAVVLAIRVARMLSPEAHLNPAVTVAMAVFRPASFAPRRAPAFIAAQTLGAAAAGGLVLAAFGAPLRAFEAREGIERGAPGSERSAMIFGEYFPNPAAAPAAPVTALHAAALEAAATAVLIGVVLALADATPGSRAARAGPWIVGAVVAAAIVAIAAETQACLNPARDLGPRLVAWAAGFGATAIPGPGGGFWVYVVGPVAGALLAGTARAVTDRVRRGARP